MKKILIKKSQYKGLPLFPDCSPYVKQHLDDAVDMCNMARRGKKTIVACKIDIDIDRTEWEDVISDNGDCVVRMVSDIAEKIENSLAVAGRGGMGFDDCPVHAAWRFYYFQNMSSKYQIVLLIDPEAYFAQQSICDPYSALRETVTMAWAKSSNTALAKASEQILFSPDCVREFQCDSNGIHALFPTIGMLCSDRGNCGKVFINMFGTTT